MATYAIGDIQGCYAEFRALLDRLRFDPGDDRLWLVGDLVNRGPHSLEVVRFVKRLGARAIVTLGNHDLHLLAAAIGGGTALRRRDTFDALLAAPDRDELLDWLRHRPLLHHDAELGYTMAHAGLPPEWDLALARRCAGEVETVLRGARHGEFLQVMYGDEPARWSDDLAGVDRLRYAVNCLTRLRFVRADGTLELGYKGGVAEAPAGFIPWFAHPARRTQDLHLVFGHWSTLGAVAGHGVYPLDTGCVWGGRLTALRLDGDGGWTTVPCAQYSVPKDD